MKEKRLYLFAFLIPLFVMLGICIANGVYPFGENSFMHCDMYHQYVPFLIELWRKLHSGESLSYAWNLGIGADFTTIYGYYLATPSNWLVYFWPKDLIIEFMTMMIVIKIALCGLTFSYYLKEKFQTTSPIILGFSTLYALSGFIAAYNWNHMWMDVIWLTPLVILGLEKLIKEKNGTLYCISLTASIFTNYYLSIMLCLFLVLYFAVLLFTNGLKWKEKIRAIGNFSLYSLLAGGMSSVLLVPVLFAMHNTEFSDISFPKTLEFYFNGLEMVARHFVTVPKEIGLDHWPNIYCGVMMFFLIPMYLFCGKIPLKQRITKVLLAAFMLLSFATNMLNFIWHGLNYPDSLPARQSFLYIFLLLTMGFEAIYHIKAWKKLWMIVSGIVAVGILAACGIFVTSDGFTVAVCAFTWAFLGFYVAIYFSDMIKKDLHKICLWVAVAIMIVEGTFNMYETSVGVVQRNYYKTKWNNYEVLLENTKDDNQLYRYESYCAMTKNDGAIAGYKGVSIFSSTTNSRVADFYDETGMQGSKVSYFSDGITPFSSAFLAVKYTFSEEEEDSDFYEEIDKSGDMYLYENKYSLPIGFCLDSVLTKQLEEAIKDGGSNGIKLQTDLAFLLGANEHLFAVEGRTKEDNAITLTQEGHYYAYIVGDPGETVVMSYGEETRTYDDLKKNCIIDIGKQEDGVTLSFEPEEEDKSLNIYLYRMNASVLEDVINKMNETPFITQENRDGYLKGTVSMKEDGNLFFSIPYEKGWKITVDGQGVEPAIFADTFIMLPLEAGEHSIIMEYHPLKAAVAVGMTGISVLFFTLLTYKKRKSSNPVIEQEKKESEVQDE